MTLQNQNWRKLKPLKRKKTSQLDSKTAIEWTEKQLILNKILNILKSPELISFPDFEKPFIVYCVHHKLG